MEPRPSRPSRPSQPYISTGATPSQPAGTPVYGQGGSLGGPGPFDASSAPPAGAPLIGYDPTYSPGQPLTPLPGRGSRILAPLLAVAALAIIVAAIAWAVGRARGGNDSNPVVGQNSPVAATSTVAADSGTEGQAPTDETTPNPGDENTAVPTEAPAAGRGAVATLTDGQKEGTRRAEAAAAEDSPTPRPSRERDDARSWLPLTEEVGEGYQRTDNGRRDLAEVAGAFPDTADAETQLQAFGWVENVYRQFELPDADPSATNVYIVSVHRFETAQGAKDALPYFLDGARAGGVEEARGLPDAGDQIRALEGATADGARQFVVYVRINSILVRIAGTSAEGDPREDVLALVDRLVAE